MNWWRKLRKGFRALFHKDLLDAQMDDEMRLHIEMQTQENIEAGLNPEEARYAALRQFGRAESIKETCRDQRGFRWVEQFGQDLRYGARTLRQNPGFTSVAVLTLALGIGANTAMFTLVNALLLRSLPVPEPARLVRLSAVDGGFRDEAFPYVFFQQFREAAPSHLDISGVESRTTRRELRAVNLGVRELEPVNAQAVSGNFFSTLGEVAQLGRVLTPEDDRGDVALAAVVLAHGYWQRRFGADATVIGKTIQMDNVSFTIVGVAPPGFRGLDPAFSPDLWWPLQMVPVVEPADRDLVRARPRAGEWLTVFGRLRKGVTVEQGRAALNAFYQVQLGTEIANRGAQWDEARRRRFLSQSIELHPAGIGTSLGRKFARLFGIFIIAAGVVLLIACANVAGLLLARGATRAREFALRSALGAGRGRLIRQLITESLLLALLGGALGIVFARWGTNALANSNYFPQNTRVFDLALDRRGLLFAMLVSVGSGLVFGLVPALRFSRLDLATAMKNQSGQATGGARLRLNHSLVVAQIALSFILLAGAGLFLQTLRNLHSLDLGFRPENIVLFSLEFPRDYGANQQGDLHARLLRALEGFPGVRTASLSGGGIMSGDVFRTRFAVEGYTPGPEERLQVSAVIVGPRFFETMRIPLLRGREITWTEIAASGAEPQSVVISESMARRYFAGTDPIGRTILHGTKAMPLTVVGVAKDTKYQNLREKTPLEYYIPYAGSLLGSPMTVHVSTTSKPAALEFNLRPLVSRIDPRLRLKDVRTMEETIDRTIVQERAIAHVAGFFSVFALTLASLGLYGVLSYGVTQRTREIGVRMALGATTRDILSLVVRQGMLVALLGCALGVVAAAAITRLIGDLLFGVAPGDPMMLLTTMAVLIPVALLASWLPARRATKVDPMVALRTE